MLIEDLNLLVAESDEFQRRWLVVMLTNLGAKHIIEVPDGLTALNVLRDKTQRIDISFIEPNMPGMDGMELIRHLARENHPTAIILASALDRALLFTVETMCHAYGVDLLGAIEKPATPEALQALIKLYQSPQTRHKAASGIPTFTYAELQQGLTNREFDPLYQPKVEFATGQVKGAEAFVRWRHPVYGILAPEAFISTLEDSGEMDTLSWLVIEKSIAACRGWHEEGFPISVSINLSPTSLAKPGLATDIIEYVASEKVAPQDVILEITESATVTNVPYFLENLARLRMNGFGLSVDDYGTGHSSMQQLMRIPFSELKIDRSFVAGASQNQALEMVLSSSLALSRKLNRHSVAVGVETQQDWDFLHKLGCTYAQGYYVAKPMEGDALFGWMKEWSQFF